MVHFRKRIGEEGVELIFKMSVDIQQEDVKGTDILVDTTVQEKNTTFPTDGKLYDRIIRKTLKIAEKEGIKLR